MEKKFFFSTLCLGLDTHLIWVKSNEDSSPIPRFIFSGREAKLS